MAAIDDVWLAALTKDEDDAGSRNRFNLTVNIDGGDVFRHDFLLGWNLPGQGGTGLRDGQAGLEEATAAGALRFRQADQLLRAPWPSRRRRVGTEARHGHRPCAARLHARPLPRAGDGNGHRPLAERRRRRGAAHDARAPRRRRHLQYGHPSCAAAGLHRPRRATSTPRATSSCRLPPAVS